MASYGGIAYQKWPSLTSASASSYHDPNPTEFYPRFAIDDNTTTFWNDNTQGQYPDSLTITLPNGAPVNLTGLLVISNPGGYLLDYTVTVRTRSQYGVAATKSGINMYYSVVDFHADGSMTNAALSISEVEELTITVSQAQPDVPGGDFSRINEVYPVFYNGDESGGGAQQSSSSSSTSTSPTGVVTVTVAPTTTTSKPTSASSTTITPSISAANGRHRLAGGKRTGMTIGSMAMTVAIAACVFTSLS